MPRISGKLSKRKRGGFQVALATRKGSALFPVPESAINFDRDRVTDGIEVEVERDEHNRIISVTVPDDANLREKIFTEGFTTTRPETSGLGLAYVRALIDRQMADEIVPIELYIDPGEASSEDIAELYFEISKLYRMMGGPGIDFRLIDAREPSMAGAVQ